MGFFGKGKILDLTEKEDEMPGEYAENPAGAAELSKALGENSEQLSSEEKKKRFVKRIVFLTEKIDELSNQIYHLQQRIEVLEKKAGVSHTA